MDKGGISARCSVGVRISSVFNSLDDKDSRFIRFVSLMDGGFFWGSMF